MSSSAPKTHTPARKRSGLKHTAAPDSQTDGTPLKSSATAAQTSANESGASAKRKPSAAPLSDHSAKKQKREGLKNGNSLSNTPKTPKSVSFAAEPEVLSSPAPQANGKKAKKAKKQKQDTPASKTATEPNSKNPANSAKPLTKKLNSSTNLESALEYLRLWHSARDQWKFNKNHQTRLLEYVFSEETTIPAFDINIFYEYIQPLKGYVRKRLRETAEQIRQKDMEQGAAGFASSSKDVAARKQADYEQVITGYLQKDKSPEKRRFEEVEYVLRTSDREMQQRVVKRMRAESVLEELADSEVESDDTTSGSATTNGSARAGPSSNGGPAVDEGDKRVKLNDGSQRKLRRNRKVRTTEVDDDSSSSSSESESDSDTSSSSGSDGSSDDSDSDEEMNLNPGQSNADTSSSSSSSSSESSDSSSDDDSSDEED